MKTFRRPDLPRYQSWREERTAAGQWDSISGSILGNWASLSAARAHLEGKRLAYGLGFFTEGDSLNAARVPGGLILLEFTAKGLFAEKFRGVQSSQPVSYSLENVNHSWAGSGIPNPVPKIEWTYIKPVLDVSAAWKQGAGATVDYSQQGKPITGVHWAAVKAGYPAMPPVGINPHTSGDFRWHYPYNWSFEIIPGDSLGTGTDRLSLLTFRFTHQWKYTH